MFNKAKVRLAGNHTLVGLVLAGVLLRLLIAPFCMHVDPRFGGDLVVLYSRANWILFQPEWFKTHALWYPPPYYFSQGLYQVLVIKTPIYALEAQFLAAPTVFRTLTLLKVWYLLFDLGAAFLLYKMARDRAGRALSLFWLLNPLVVYNAYFHGQFDVVPLFFIILSLYFCQRGRSNWGVFWMGIAACYKTFPLLLLLPAILILAETWRKRFSLLLLGTLPYLALMLPFMGRSSASLNNYPNWFFTGGYDLGFGAQVYFFLAFYAALLWYLHHRKAYTFEDLWRACFAILLVYYQFSYFDLHYWVWMVPFAALYWAERPREAKPFYLVIGLCLLVLLAPTPLARFLAPISPRFFLRLPSLVEALNPYLPMLFIVNVVRSLMAGTCSYLAWRLLRDMPASRSAPLQAAPQPGIA